MLENERLGINDENHRKWLVFWGETLRLLSLIAEHQSLVSSCYAKVAVCIAALTIFINFCVTSLSFSNMVENWILFTKLAVYVCIYMSDSCISPFGKHPTGDQRQQMMKIATG